MKHNELYDGIQVVGPTKDGHSPREAKKTYGESALSILADGKRKVSGSAKIGSLLIGGRLTWMHTK